MTKPVPALFDGRSNQMMERVEGGPFYVLERSPGDHLPVAVVREVYRPAGADAPRVTPKSQKKRGD